MLCEAFAQQILFAMEIGGTWSDSAQHLRKSCSSLLQYFIL
jgi:hypothetical protein